MAVKKSTKKVAKKTAVRKKATKKKASKTINLNTDLDNPNKENRLKVSMKPIGKSGTFVSSGLVRNDHITSLDGPEGQETSAKMILSDSQVRKIYHAMTFPIKSAKWSIEPTSDDQKDIEAAALIEQILFKDLPSGWKSKLDEILTYPFHGFACFEVIHRNFVNKAFGPYTGLANIAFRDQRTLDQFEYDKDTGSILRVKQKQSGDLDVDTWMDADTLIFFFNERKGSDMGYPFCRMLYGPYQRKLLAKKLQIIGVERSAIPVPHLELPENVRLDSNEAIAAQSQLENFTNAEQAYFMTPYGWKLNYHNTNTFDPSKVQVVVKSENEEMAGSIVAMFLEMGIGGNSGNQAGVEGSINFFNQGIAHIADNIVDIINSSVIPSLIALNFGDTLEALPELAHSGISDDAGLELMQIITGYSEKQIITPDEQLEDYVRRKHNLPKKAEGEQLENQSAQDDTTPPDDTPAPPAEDVELADKAMTVPDMITEQGARITNTIRENAKFTAGKLINDIMKKYKQLPEAKKQNAVRGVKLGGQANMRKVLKQNLTDVFAISLAQARKEVPVSGEVSLNEKTDLFMGRISEKFGDYGEIKLNEFSSLPTHAQVLIALQSDLITKDTLEDLENRVAFQFSSSQLSTNSEDIIRQDLENAADDYIESATMATKGINVSSIMTNEARDTYFFAPEVEEQVHSFTFTNAAPKTAICTELAGTTFKTNDAESLRFTPPLHHNCKSYLRANLNTSKGIENLEVTKLAPSAKAQKNITL